MVLGILMGILPGIGPNLGCALLLGLTYGLPPETALIAMGGMYTGAVYGGSITSILLGIPGTAASSATCIEGYAMTKKGEAAKALGAALNSSFIGGVVGVASLFLLSPVLTKVALIFGPPEYFMFGIASLTVIPVLSRKHIAKGFVMCILGLTLSTVGLDPVRAYPRFTFGWTYLNDGVDYIVVVIGVYAMSEALALTQEETSISRSGKVTGNVWEGVRATVSYPVTLIRSIVIGIVTGIMPGIGGATSNIIAYNEAVRTSKTPERFGTGEVEGVIAPEACNNASVGATLIPTLTLGIPGNSVAAIILGGLILHGLFPGPNLFRDHSTLTYTFFYGLLIAQFLMFAVGLLVCKWAVNVTRIPSRYLIPTIVVLCFVGAYGIRNSLLDIAVLLVFGVLGYLFKKNDYPIICLVLGMVLGAIIERGLLRSLVMSGGSYSIFVTRPLSLTILILTVVIIILTFSVRPAQKPNTTVQ